jgi:hypothetical protein
MEDHIYFEDSKLTCSICNNSEVHNGDGFNNFKIHPIRNKSIANPSDTNSDMEYWAECLKCRKSTNPIKAKTPYLYY